MGPLLVINQKCGRLGNRLTLMAHVLAFAMERGAQVVDLAFGEYADLFERYSGRVVASWPFLTPRVPFVSSMRKLAFVLARTLFRDGGKVSRLLRGGTRVGWLTLSSLEERCHFDEASGEVARSMISEASVVVLDGWWFRDATAVRRHGDEIRALFAPAVKHANRIADTLGGLRGSADVVVGIHIRREDYRLLKPEWVYGDEYYRQLVLAIVDLFAGKSCAFLIASNEQLAINWPDGVRVGYASGNIIEDLYSLAECDYLVGVPSTFCQWASFYGKTPCLVLTRERLDISLGDFEVCEVPWGI
jgi:hypothetical protein